MSTQHDIVQPVFTAYLASSKIPSDECFYTFGNIDQDVVTKCGGTIQWTPVDASNGF